jgi:hypothetical protein
VGSVFSSLNFVRTLIETGEKINAIMIRQCFACRDFFSQAFAVGNIGINRITVMASF